jgi:hypothetical protein
VISVTRFKPYFQIALCLGVLAVVLNGALTALSATPVLGWLPRTMAGVGYLEDSRSRVEGAVREYRDDSFARANRLAAVVGISNVRQGVDLGVVAQSAGPEWRFLGLAGAGLGIDDVVPYANLLVTSDLRPDVIVVGLGLYQLVDSRPKPGATQVTALQYLRRGDLRNFATEVRNSIWIYSRHRDISVAVQGGLLGVRTRLFNMFGVELSASEKRQRTPWREMMKSDWPEHFSRSTLGEEEQFFSDLGIFQESTYQNSPKAMAMLVRIIKQFRERQAEVVLVFMPEHSTLQRRVPAGAWDIVQDRLKKAFSDMPPRTMDFRKAVGDDGFVDLTHLNRHGSLEFSQELAKALAEVWPHQSAKTPSQIAAK